MRTNKEAKVVAAKQLASLAGKADLEDVIMARDLLIALCRVREIEVTASEECPPSNPSCDEPDNPPPGGP